MPRKSSRTKRKSARRSKAGPAGGDTVKEQYRKVWTGALSKTKGGLTREDLVERLADGTTIYFDGTRVPPPGGARVVKNAAQPSRIVSRKRYELAARRWDNAETLTAPERDMNGKLHQTGARVWRNSENVITHGMKPCTSEACAEMRLRRHRSKGVLQ